jgi:serine/threonine-protein kinase
MGVVLGVTDEHTGDERALKLLNRPEARVDAARVLREGRALMRISSPHVVRIFDAAELTPWGPYLVLERLIGQNLAALAPAGARWPWRDAAQVAIQVCDALTVVHSVGVVHRDIKPSNLFLASELGRRILKVLDFGIAKEVGLSASTAASTLTKGNLGSPQFMSPEQIATPRAVDARTDLWSLGVVMFRLVTGRLPFTGASLGLLTASVLQARVPPIDATIPPAFQATLHRCLEKKAEQRWSSAAELGSALRAVLASG